MIPVNMSINKTTDHGRQLVGKYLRRQHSPINDRDSEMQIIQISFYHHLITFLKNKSIWYVSHSKNKTNGFTF